MPDKRVYKRARMMVIPSHIVHRRERPCTVVGLVQALNSLCAEEDS